MNPLSALSHIDSDLLFVSFMSKVCILQTSAIITLLFPNPTFSNKPHSVFLDHSYLLSPKKAELGKYYFHLQNETFVNWCMGR